MKFVSEKFYLMGTNGKIQIFVKNIYVGNLAIIEAINRIKEIENLLTKFSPYSDIGRINNSPFSYNKVSNETLYILRYGLKISTLTNGYFDMGLGNLLSFSGIDDIPLVGGKTLINDVKSNLLKFDNDYVMLIRNNTMLDLGGIGKGYALDEAMKIFLKYDIKHVVLEFGGEIKVNGGMPNGNPWIIFINNDLSFLFNDELKFLEIYTGSIAISGSYLKRGNISKAINHHIINPKSLKSNNNFFLVSVIGKDSIICDALSTACFCIDYMSLCKVKTLFPFYDIKFYV